MHYFERHRRLRQTPTLRRMLQEHHVSVDDLIYPLFISEVIDQPEPISSMPGQYQWPLSHLEAEIKELVALGIPSVILFGIPKVKDATGSQAYAEDGIIQEAIRLIKSVAPEMVVIADNCLCEYTDHGHCGLLDVDGTVLNDESLTYYQRVALAQAEAGADIIAPSNAMDGFVTAIREALDNNGYAHLPIMSYAIKHASSFYGPFRDAADSSPQSGDRKTYQMPYGNNREAMRELKSDLDEGADIVIVKPALSFMDIVYQTRQESLVPVAVYNVSGEYSMVKAAASNGWIDERAIVEEILTSFKRAGADLIITYHAKEYAQWLRAEGK